MALEVKVQAPGGFESTEGYRRILALQIDFANQTVIIPVNDYKNKERRDDYPLDFFNPHPYVITSNEIIPKKAPNELPNGDFETVEVDGSPSYKQFIETTIGTYLQDITPETTLKDIFGAIAYGYAKTRKENANAKDV